MANLNVLVKLRNARLSFVPGLFTPKAAEDGSKPAYSVGAIIPVEHPQVQEILDAIEKVGKDKWKDQWPTVKKQLLGKDTTCLHDGDLKSYEGYAGNLYLSPRSTTRPLVLNKDRTPLTESDGVVYSGCYGNVHFEIWAQDDRKWGKRINAALKGVQFSKDGDPLGGSAPASVDEFEDLSDTGEDDYA